MSGRSLRIKDATFSSWDDAKEELEEFLTNWGGSKLVTKEQYDMFKSYDDEWISHSENMGYISEEFEIVEYE